MRNLDRRIDIFSLTETVNGAGQPIKSWSAYDTDVPASVVYMRGKNEFSDAQGTYSDRKDFKIRYDEGVKANMIVSYEGEYYNIHDINMLGRRDGWHLVCMRMRTT